MDGCSPVLGVCLPFEITHTIINTMLTYWYNAMYLPCYLQSVQWALLLPHQLELEFQVESWGENGSTSEPAKNTARGRGGHVRWRGDGGGRWWLRGDCRVHSEVCTPTYYTHSIDDDTSIKFSEFCMPSLFITLISFFLKALYVFSIYVTHMYKLWAIHSSHSCLTVIKHSLCIAFCTCVSVQFVTWQWKLSNLTCTRREIWCRNRQDVGLHIPKHTEKLSNWQ